MQLCKNHANLKHCIGNKFNVKVIKATHRRSKFWKTFVSQKIFVSKGLRKNLPRKLFLENVTKAQLGISRILCQNRGCVKN